MMIFTYNKFYYNSIIMNIIDCFMYYDEDMVLDIRLNILNKYVSHFIICEANLITMEQKENFYLILINLKNLKKK